MEFRCTFILDASYDHNTKITGIGIVIHESHNPKKNKNGILIDEIMESYSGILDGRGEMLAVYRAMEIAIDRGYKNIRTRSDYNYMRKSLKVDYENNIGSEREDLHGAVLKMSSRFDCVKFGYKPRRKNQMAHTLARRARVEVEPLKINKLIELCEQYKIKIE